MVRTGVRCEEVYSFHSGRVLSVLRITGYSLAVVVYTPYGTCFISDMMLWAIVSRSVLASCIVFPFRGWCCCSVADTEVRDVREI